MTDKASKLGRVQIPRLILKNLLVFL